MSDHCEDCAPEFDCWTDASRCRKKPAPSELAAPTAPTSDRLYGLKHQEHLDSELEDVVDAVIDNACETVGETFDAIAERIEWPIRVHVFKRTDVSRYASIISRRALEDALEMLGEEHGDADGNPYHATQAMKDAAAAFGKAVVDDYVPWACEETGEVISVSREQARCNGCDFPRDDTMPGQSGYKFAGGA